MKSLFSAFLILFFFTLKPYCQTVGMFGKRNFLEINSVNNSPIIANLISSLLTNQTYLNRNRFGLLNTGIHTEYGRVINNNLSLSLELGYDVLRFDFFKDQIFTENIGLTDEYKGKVVINDRCISIMPKVSFVGKNGSLPFGYMHQIGIGYFRMSGDLISDKKHYKWSDIANEASLPVEDVYRQKNGYSVQYTFKLRSAIRKRLLINYGISYHLNIVQNSFILSKQLDWSVFSELQKTTNLISFECGLTYCF